MDNKSILKTANIAVINGDYEAFLSHCADDVIWDFVGDITLRGKESVRRYIEDTYLEPPKFEVENLIAEDDFVTAVGKISMKENGEYKSYTYCDVWRFRDGKMAELKAFVI